MTCPRARRGPPASRLVAQSMVGITQTREPEVGAWLSRRQRHGHGHAALSRAATGANQGNQLIDRLRGERASTSLAHLPVHHLYLHRRWQRRVFGSSEKLSQPSNLCGESGG